MNKILYDKITIDDNLWRVVQALIDKQGEIVGFIDGLQKMAENQEIVK